MQLRLVWTRSNPSMVWGLYAVLFFLLLFFVSAEGVADVLEDDSEEYEAPLEIIGAETIGYGDAMRLMEEGAVFIDVRMEQDWNVGRIKGAIHLDFKEDFFVLYISDLLNHNTPIVFYCNSPLSFRGAMASFFAVKWGYTNIYFFRDGYYRWLAEDMPVEFKLALNREGSVGHEKGLQAISGYEHF